MTDLASTQPLASARPAQATSQPAVARSRNGGLDALRVAMTLLVILHHTAITYGGAGGWFYREMRTDASLSSLLLTVFCAVNQAYFMGLFFLLAGYYTPASLRSKGVAAYLKDRLLRLGVPLLLFGFVLGPMTVALAQAGSPADFLLRWRELAAALSFVNGPLWFAQALLLFALVAALWHVGGGLSAPAAPAQPRAFPGNAQLALAAIGTGAAAFALRLFWPVGMNVWGLQLGYFASYTVLFFAGCLAARWQWLERIPAAQRRRWGVVALLSFPLLPAAALLAPAVPALAAPVEGGWNAMALLYACWEPLLAWGIILTLLSSFQRRFAVLSELGGRLSARAYAMFIVHAPVLVGVALSWRHVNAPALLKFLVTGLLTCWLCYLLAGWLLKLPGARRIL